MLKGIPAIISPELMSVMMRMGHGDEIVFADGDFPAETCAKRLVRLDGAALPEVLNAILDFFPLDAFTKDNVLMMSAGGYDPPKAWDGYPDIFKGRDAGFTGITFMDRFDFYTRAKEAFAVVATSEKDGNIILKKGTVNI